MPVAARAANGSTVAHHALVRLSGFNIYVEDYPEAGETLVHNTFLGRVRRARQRHPRRAAQGRPARGADCGGAGGRERPGLVRFRCRDLCGESEGRKSWSSASGSRSGGREPRCWTRWSASTSPATSTARIAARPRS